MKYLKIFNTKQDLETSALGVPNISFVSEQSSVSFERKPTIVGDFKYYIEAETAAIMSIVPDENSSFTEWTEYTIPESIEVNGKTIKITHIRTNAFQYINEDGQIFVPENLQVINLPRTIVEIADEAFYNLPNLTNVNFTCSPKIGVNAFPESAFLRYTLVERQDFINENENTFDEIVYVRTLEKDEYYTITLPFVPNELDKLSVFVFTSIEEHKFVMSKVDTFVPGTPYVIQPKETLTQLTGKTLKTSEILDYECSGSMVRGSYINAEAYTSLSTTNGVYYYGFSGSDLKKATRKLTILPFRLMVERRIKSEQEAQQEVISLSL